jgi:hypothetical protein
MLPAVLVLVLCVAHAGIRKEGEVEEKEVANAKAYTVSDLIAVVRLVREVEQAQASEGQYAQRVQPAAVGAAAETARLESARVDAARMEAARGEGPKMDSPKMVPTLAASETDRPDPELEQNVMQLLTARAGKRE